MNWAERKIFITRYADQVLQGSQDSGLFPSVVMAQLILETGWGRSIRGNNLFGIKAQGSRTPFWDGSVVEFMTTEYVDGKPVKRAEKFRKYANEVDSISDHNYFIVNNSRYRKAGVLSAPGYKEQARLLRIAGYATDPGYDVKLVSIIESNSLSALDLADKKKIYNPVMIGLMAAFMVTFVSFYLKIR